MAEERSSRQPRDKQLALGAWLGAAECEQASQRLRGLGQPRVHQKEAMPARPHEDQTMQVCTSVSRALARTLASCRGHMLRSWTWGDRMSTLLSQNGPFSSVIASSGWPFKAS